MKKSTSESMVFGLPFIKLASLALRHATKPIIRGAVRATMHPQRQDYVYVKILKASYWSLGKMSLYAGALVSAEPMPNISKMPESAVLDHGVEVLLELVVFLVGSYIMYSEYQRSVAKELKKDVEMTLRLEHLAERNSQPLQQRIDDLEIKIKQQAEELEALKANQKKRLWF
eukprot:PhF_6_TR3949/c0_g1_i1/m.5509